MPKLKVYRTAAGFHDAYVAAPSQKAALKAWGSDHDLFARGIAEMVTDPALTAEPLAHPGEVIRRSRGSADEQLAALPDSKPKPRRKADPAPAPKPRPSRAALDEAEAALEELSRAQKKEAADLARREAALARERKDLTERQSAERVAREAARDDAKSAYDRAVKRWRN